MSNAEEWKPLLVAVEYAEAHLGEDLGWPRIKQWQLSGLVIMRGINGHGEDVQIGRGWLDRLAKRPALDPPEGMIEGQVESVGGGRITDRPQRSTISPDIAGLLRYISPPPEVPTNDDTLYFETPATDRNQVLRQVQVRMDALRRLIGQPPKRPRGRPGVAGTCAKLFERRRKKSMPLLKHKIAEARAIRAEWPSNDRPQDETIAEHISTAWDEAKAAAPPDKL
jgi:hypothetical protein